MPDRPREDATQDFEEKISFMERELDHLRDQLADVWKELGALEKRLDRLTRLLEPTDSEN